MSSPQSSAGLARSFCCGGSDDESCKTTKAAATATAKAATTSSAVMSTLILTRASVSRPSGQWREDDYDVLEDGIIVGRIFCLDAVGPQGRPWMWASSHNADSSAPRTV